MVVDGRRNYLKKYKRRSIRKGKYKSKLEAQVAKRLGKNAKYESEVIHYLLPKKYTPDFVVNKETGKMYIEVKGWFRYEDQQKMRAVKTSNPTLDIRMFFPQDGKVQGSKMTNSQWCKKYDIPCSIGVVPKDWR